MFRNYLKFAFRNLEKHKRHAIINIMGLAVALAACLVIFLVLKQEYSYDTYHKNADRIYQLVKKQNTPDGESFDIGTPLPITAALRNDFPQVTFAEMFSSNGSQVAALTNAGTSSNKKFIEDIGVFYTDPEMFSLFDVTWLSGNAAVLKNDNTAILSKSEAEKYFGDWKQAMGKYIKVDNTVTARISGIIDDVPSNTDFPFKIVLSYESFLSNIKALGFASMQNQWGAVTSNHQVYALLPATVSPQSIDKGLVQFVDKYFKKDISKSQKITHFLQPLKNIHFDARFGNNGTHISSKSSLYTLAFIGILILLMACINFINLSTALAVKRSREVGIRKVMGSSGRQITAQVMIETGVIVLFAALLSLGLAYLSLPYLKYIVQIQDRLPLISSSSILFLLATVLVTTLLSGAYPSLILSRFKPVEAMRNKIDSSRIGGISLRRILVVLQFSFSQILIIATIIALNQMHFIKTADLGFNKEAILLLRGNNDSASLAKLDAFKASLQSLPEVASVSFGFDAPSSGNNWNANFGFNNSTIDETFFPNLKFGDGEYQKTFGLKMAAGRFYTDDSLKVVVVNETLVHKLGFKDPEKVIGKTLRLGGAEWQTIVGVVKDFKNNSLRDAIPPTVLLKVKRYYASTAIKLKSKNLAASSEKIRIIWDKFFPEYAYNSSFLDENINRFYEQEERLSTLYKVYALLAIFISCLGLYGLVSFMAVQKTKEVGIRKVLGASIANIVFLFSKEFTLLIGIAFLIAVPAGYYLMQNWLQRFVFRVDVGIGVFVIAIVLSLLIALITVGYKAIKAAVANPVKSLRTE